MSKLVHVPFKQRLAISNMRKHSPKQCPIDPFVIAETLGITLLESEFKHSEISGLIQKKNELFTIHMKKEASGFEKRWIVAHLLGHFALHMMDRKDQSFMDSCGIWNHDLKQYPIQQWINENEANQFAMDLLMDEEQGLSTWKRFGSAEMVAAKFHIPLAIARMKIEEWRNRQSM